MRYRDYSSRMNYIRQRKEQLCDTYDDDFKGYSHAAERKDADAPGVEKNKKQSIWKRIFRQR